MPGSKTFTVLLLDDSTSIRLLLRRTLEGLALRIVEAATVNEAWGLIAVERPALIIMELRLPGPDPLDICRVVRHSRQPSGTRVIVLTTMTGDSARRRALEAGADVFLTKPFRPLQLLEAVERLLAPRTNGQQQFSAGYSPS